MAYNELEPSASGAEGIGLVFLSQKNYSKAIEFFKKAVESADNNEDKAEYNLNIAKANLYAKSYAAARTYAQKAAALKSGWGAPYMVIGDAYMAGARNCDDGKLGKFSAYWAAVDKYQKAKSIDGSVAADASKKIARAGVSYPATKDLFFYSVKDGDSYTCGCWINETTTVRSKK